MGPVGANDDEYSDEEGGEEDEDDDEGRRAGLGIRGYSVRAEIERIWLKKKYFEIESQIADGNTDNDSVDDESESQSEEQGE